MTNHPAKAAGCTKAQIAAFEQICIGQKPVGPVHLFDRLEKKGLIEKKERILCYDRFGPVFVPEYSVPIPIHMQWCQWASEQPEIVDESERA